MHGNLLTLVVCVELLLELLHLLVVPQERLVLLQGPRGLLFLLLHDIAHQRVLVIVCDAWGTTTTTTAVSSGS